MRRNRNMPSVFIVSCVKNAMTECPAGFECSCNEKEIDVILVTSDKSKAQQTQKDHDALSREHMNYCWCNIDEYPLEEINHRSSYTGMLR
jgi:hypothetical protein